ncbi:antibiotic biosynthesis monooxygenase [Rhodococcus fascians]|uniref:putative quinol monooxygenase n=1 Tax=Rhodococcoides fascians TaxID=1828 RepID=UPI00195F2DFF|nr:putative quinol monooxygenase [Rhodococcus fascians]MBM7244231.1 antibiotic biosynthesis monooxygenase [Rhodococcus fascians]MBY3810413.1 antibiotic biosynthesis monooxygenase [Rhodococcus fascians]MBY3841964.1 antibiotic biosynthesis monooxygenase [Rhodococcus fascians]MBY3844415.1 antibiotic biosynthesis monooxygenase [Rhodococcus fascians]MBY3850361.1 antibiotic biosynthesis monooxygenase [Rhodococcus fascians]
MSDIVDTELLSSEGPVAFYGYAQAKEGARHVLLERMLALGEPSRAEPGILVYEIHHDTTRPDCIAFYELYAHGAAIREHLEQPYMKAFFADSDALLQDDLEITALELLRPTHAVLHRASTSTT